MQGLCGPPLELSQSRLAGFTKWPCAIYIVHLLSVYGFSIIEIVKDNPKEKTIHFGGIKGQAIRQRYMDMSYRRNVKNSSPFGDINNSIFERPSCDLASLLAILSWVLSLSLSLSLLGLLLW
jgi:hypothetical protein